jgi:SPP1 family predicted phage head-tail adaptor
MKTKSKNFNTGMINKRCLFQNMQAGAGDGMGGGSSTWGDAIMLWANIDPISGKERLQMQLQNTDIAYMITVRWCDYNITAKSRMKYDNRVFNLHYVINEGEDNYYLQMAASEQQ